MSPAFLGDEPWRCRFVDEDGLVVVEDAAVVHMQVSRMWPVGSGLARSKRFFLFWVDPWASEVVYRP